MYSSVFDVEMYNSSRSFEVRMRESAIKNSS